jgi:Tfp pilus assembly protein PilV
MKRVYKLDQLGDTIVEVMVSMAILAVVLGTAYATTTRSFHSGLNAQARDKALLIAQQQIELIKNADSGPSPTISTYKNYLGPAFCINPSDGSIIPLSTSRPSCTAPLNATAGSGATFDMADSYNSSKKLFTIKVQWQAENNRQNQVVLNYKASDSYVQ